ncbi:Stp1/IreP family PP2C-type Ser/Thr phosphatase [Deinococcus cellulosilyticus]|uniref:Stp1/IreP family PP2C-type Ser/Thr phosphatase n=1 Tax=Deinococcus cellulosilyticus TaxID=401558 RepID=UPI001649A41D|nr:Stp1/IreP family PP2C-type Ser/Thr phosphatase [Deinococcus cellulosilyticus]
MKPGALNVSYLTDQGRIRNLNEDAILTLTLPYGGLYAVADGMGGHRSGDYASQLALKELQQNYAKDKSSNPHRLLQAIEAANQAVYQASRAPDKRGMGTTLTTVLIEHNYAWIANIGDSRAYLFRDGHMTQITRDHSWVAEQVRAGIITEEEALKHTMRNVLINAMGSSRDVKLDLYMQELEYGDLLLICTDGIHGMLMDTQIEQVLKTSQFTEDRVKNLVHEANEAGGIDNISAIVIEVQKLRPQKPPVKAYTVPQNPQGIQYYYDLFGTRQQGNLLWLWVMLVGLVLLFIEVMVLTRQMPGT